MNKKQTQIIKQYVYYARKLGKLPSSREFHKLGVTKDAVAYNFETHNKLKTVVLELHPSLQELEVPVKLVVNDVDVYRVDSLKKEIKKANKLTNI